MDVALEEVRGGRELRLLETLVRTDERGVEEFGGFYGRAVERLGPLLGRGRRVWLVVAAGSVVGFIDADLDGGAIGWSWFVQAAQRRQGVARSALDLLTALDPWPSAQSYLAVVGHDNSASRRLASAAGFRCEGRAAEGDEVWRREA